MNAQQLRGSILQNAMQGKLVKQNQKDESVQQLLKKLQDEKKQLIKIGEIKNEVALPNITEDEIPFEIPHNWRWERLGNLSSKIHYGYTASAQVKGNAKLLRITDIQNNQVDWETTPYCSIEESKLESLKLKERDILIARTGGTIGKSFLISHVNYTSVFASYLIRVQPLTDINAEYLMYYLQSELYWRQLRKMSAGTGQPNVNAQNLKKLILPIPPLEEQSRIVNEIRFIEKKIVSYSIVYERNQAVRSKFTTDLEKSILQYAMKGMLVQQSPSDESAVKLVERINKEKERLIQEKVIKKQKKLSLITEEEIPYDIPACWQWVRIGEIFNLQAGKNITSSEIFENQSEENNYPCYGGNGLRGYVRTFNREGKYVLIGRQGALCGNINFANGKFYATEHAVVVEHFEMIDVNWSGYFLKGLNLNQYATATAQPGLAVSNIVNKLIPLPPLEEQKRIVAKIEAILSKTKSLRSKILFD